MELNEAISFLPNDIVAPGKTKWADLGCGTGTFTLALASMLKPLSTIYALDADSSSLKRIPGNYNGVVIEKQQGNFEKDELPFTGLDGILMANSLHYVKDKTSFINKISRMLQSAGCFLLVEYDTEKSNQWVPYPLNFLNANDLFKEAGFSSTRKLQEKPSLFGRANLYSMLIKRQV
jgi:ubiquinone/menaquinone biosynthesis C-methylase UbiE